MRREDVIWLGSLTALGVATVALVDPSGDFPLNDAWGYAPAVETLVEEGRLRFTDWQSMTLITHVLAGAAASLPFGFSHEALRFSTLVFGWLGVLATYWLALELGARRVHAALAALVVLANPIYFGLAHTFMTDVPFVATVAAAMAAWVRSERTGDARWLAGAVGLACWATLNRQLGIALPIGWLGTALLRYRLSQRTMVQGVVPLVIVLGVLVGYEALITSTVGLPALYHEKSVGLREALGELIRLRGLRVPLERLVVASLTLGLFALPLALTRVRGRKSWMAGAVGMLGGLGIAVVGMGLPFDGNILVDFGMGPRTLPTDGLRAPSALWVALSALGGLGAGLALAVAVPPTLGVVQRLLKRSGDGERVPLGTSLVLVSVIGFAPTAVVFGPYFDRYLLLQLPAIVCLLAAGAEAGARDGRSLVAAGMAVGMLVFSVAATHDYLDWQRARWKVVAELESRGIPRSEIDGGFEVNNRDPERGRGLVEDVPSAAYVLTAESGAEGPHAEAHPWLPFAIERVTAVARQPPAM